MNNIHEGAPRLMETRTTLWYLRGPVTRDEVKRLMNAAAETLAPVAAAPAARPAPAAGASPTPAPRPSAPVEAHEVYFPAFDRVSGVTCHPGLYGRAKLHFVDEVAFDLWQEVECCVPVATSEADPRWAAAKTVPPIVSAEPASRRCGLHGGRSGAAPDAGT